MPQIFQTWRRKTFPKITNSRYSNSHIKSNNQMASWKCSTWNQVRTWPCQSPSSPWTWASQAKEAPPTWLSTPWWRRPWPQAARLLSTGWISAGLMDGGRRDANFSKADLLPGSSNSRASYCKKRQPFFAGSTQVLALCSVDTTVKMDWLER